MYITFFVLNSRVQCGVKRGQINAKIGFVVLCFASLTLFRERVFHFHTGFPKGVRGTYPARFTPLKKGEKKKGFIQCSCLSDVINAGRGGETI